MKFLLVFWTFNLFTFSYVVCDLTREIKFIKDQMNALINIVLQRNMKIDELLQKLNQQTNENIMIKESLNAIIKDNQNFSLSYLDNKQILSEINSDFDQKINKILNTTTSLENSIDDVKESLSNFDLFKNFLKYFKSKFDEMSDLTYSSDIDISRFLVDSLRDLANDILLKQNIEKVAFRKTLKGHGNTVFALATLPNISYIVSGSADKTIKIWNINTGECVKNLIGHNGYVYVIEVFPKTNKIVSGSYDKTIKIWDLETAECKNTLIGHENSVCALAILPNNNHIVSSSMDYKIKIWDSETGICIKNLLGHTDWVRSLTILKSNNYVVSGSADKTIRIWNPRTGECIRKITGFDKEIIALTSQVSIFNIDQIVSISGHIVNIWNSNTGDLIRTLYRDRTLVWPIVLIPNTNYLVCGSNNHTVKIWNLVTSELVNILNGHTNDIYSLTILSNNTIVSGGRDFVIKIWN